MSGVKYRTIVADPPWHYDGFATLRGPCTSAEVQNGWREHVRIEQRPIDYPTMTLDEISALPIRDLAASDCRLFLWTTQRYMPAAFGVLEAWGFTYRQTLVWRKISSFSPFGGSIAPNNVEFALVAKRGSPSVVTRASSCVIDAPGFAGRRKAHGRGVTKHSRKPEAFLDLVEQVSAGPYLELFARRQRLGWDTWGNEALEHVELTALEVT